MCFSFALKTRYCFYSSPLLLTSLTVWFLQSQIPKGLFPPFVLRSELPLPSSVITYMKATFNSKPLSPSLWVRQGLLLTVSWTSVCISKAFLGNSALLSFQHLKFKTHRTPPASSQPTQVALNHDCLPLCLCQAPGHVPVPGGMCIPTFLLVSSTALNTAR